MTWTQTQCFPLSGSGCQQKFPPIPQIRELDAVRQAEMDLVDRLFRRGVMFMDAEHDALEDAVCSLAPRLFKVGHPHLLCQETMCS